MDSWNEEDTQTMARELRDSLGLHAAREYADLKATAAADEGDGYTAHFWDLVCDRLAFGEAAR